VPADPDGRRPRAQEALAVVLLLDPEEPDDELDLPDDESPEPDDELDLPDDDSPEPDDSDDLDSDLDSDLPSEELPATTGADRLSVR
jgi:hypothetical protein